MLDIAIVEGVRTPFAKAFGALASVPAYDLGRRVTQVVLERAGVWSAWTNTSTNPPAVQPGPEPGLWTPGGELGELWTNEPLIQELLGYALEEAYHPFESRVQIFEFGTMLLSHTGQVYVIYDDGAWEFYTDPGSTE